MRHANNLCQTLRGLMVGRCKIKPWNRSNVDECQHSVYWKCRISKHFIFKVLVLTVCWNYHCHYIKTVFIFLYIIAHTRIYSFCFFKSSMCLWSMVLWGAEHWWAVWVCFAPVSLCPGTPPGSEPWPCTAPCWRWQPWGSLPAPLPGFLPAAGGPAGPLCLDLNTADLKVGRISERGEMKLDNSTIRMCF